MDSCLIWYNTHIPSCFPANDFKTTTTTFILNPFEYQTRKHWVCDKTCFSSSYHLPQICSQPLTLQEKNLCFYLLNYSELIYRMLTQGPVRPFLTECVFHQIFTENLSAITCLKNPKQSPEVQQLVCCLGRALGTWFLPGQPMIENESFLFHSDMGQMYNISFSFHPLLFQSETFPSTEVFEEKKKFLSYFINKWNEPRITYMCIYLLLYVYKLIHIYTYVYISFLWQTERQVQLLATFCIT